MVILPKKFIKAVESKCSVLLWKGKAANLHGAKVARSVLCTPKCEGD